MGKNGVELTCKVTVKPVIEISDYKGIKAPKEVKAITDEDIDKQIEMIRKKNARIVSVEDRPAQMDDEVVIDFEGFFGDEPFKLLCRDKRAAPESLQASRRIA